MPLSSEKKKEIFEKYGKSVNDTGPPEVQIAMVTSRLEYLTEHLKANPKDHHTRRGLLKLVGKRRRLLNYLMRKDIERYRAVIKEFGLRR